MWLASSYDFTRRLEDVEQRTAAITGRFVESERLLSSIQVQLLLGSLYLRDAITDTPTSDDYYREQLQETRSLIEAALEQYRPMLDSPEENRVFGTLRGEIADFWNLASEVLTTRGTRSPFEARVELRRRVIPKRDVILHVLEQVQTLHRGAFDAQRTDVSRVYGGMRTRVWTMRVVVFLLSLSAAVLVTWYRARLEKQVRRQIERDAEHTRDLQRLSARLVQAQEDERRTIARELHDEIGQALTAAKMEVALAKRALPASTHAADYSTSWRPLPIAPFTPSATCRSCSIRHCWTTLASSQPSNGTPAVSPSEPGSASTWRMKGWTSGCRPKLRHAPTGSSRKR